jgi:hypothetical protein
MLEFVYPTPNGKSFHSPVVNISASGLSFSLEAGPEMPQLEEGASVPDVVLSVGDCSIRGEILVMHVTADPDSRYVCGALFYPSTDTDLVKLKGVIAGMEAAGTD